VHKSFKKKGYASETDKFVKGNNSAIPLT